MISYKEQLKCNKLMNYSQKSSPKRQDMTEMNKMVEWNEVQSEDYVNLEPEVKKVLVVKDWKLEHKNKFGEDCIEFSANVVEEDEKEVEKMFTTTSKRLMRKLRELFENHPKDQELRFSVKKVGKSFETQYDVEKL